MRLSVISTIVNIVVLSVGTIFVFKEAITSLLSPEPVMANGMFVFAIFGIIINGISVLRMKISVKISWKTVMLYLLEDLFGWIAVLLVSIVMMFINLYILDPILLMIICVIMARNIYYNISSIYKIIMQATPINIDTAHIRDGISEIVKETLSIRMLNIWTLDGESNIATVQLKANKEVEHASLYNFTDEIKLFLSDNNISDSTVEIIPQGTLTEVDMDI
jgi:cobalt-zinc-cadmium efflux system protein